MMRGKKIEIRRLCRAHPQIEFLYLFGSYGRGNAGPLSDLDFAVYLNPSVSPKSYFQASVDLIGKFSHLLHSNEVDIVILNQAPLSLQYQIVFEGRLLYERHRLQRILFETKVTDLFFDSEPLRATSRAYLKDQIKKGTFVG